MNIPALLEQITYRPGWRFTYERGCITVTARLRNAYGNCPYRVPVNGYVIDAWRYRSERSLLHAIRQAIIDVEYHELAETFKLRGRRPFYTGHTERGF